MMVVSLALLSIASHATERTGVPHEVSQRIDDLLATIRIDLVTIRPEFKEEFTHHKAQAMRNLALLNLQYRLRNLNPIFIEGLENLDIWVQESAALGLAFTPDPVAIPHLRRILDGPSTDNAKKYALRVFFDVGGAKGTQELLETLNHSNRRVIRLAVEALATGCKLLDPREEEYPRQLTVCQSPEIIGRLSSIERRMNGDLLNESLLLDSTERAKSVLLSGLAQLPQ